MVTHSSTIVPSGEDGNTRCENINQRTVVAERGLGVRAVSRTDGECSWLGCRRVVGSIPSIVTSGNSHEDASRYHASSSAVHCGGFATTKRHVGHSTIRAAASLGVASDKVDAGDNARVGALSFDQSRMQSG